MKAVFIEFPGDNSNGDEHKQRQDITTIFIFAVFVFGIRSGG